MSRIKLILMDGDGSTLDHNGSCPDSLQKFFIQNKENYLFAMATGRSLDLLRRTEIIPFLTSNIPHIVDGGSKLMYLDEKVLFEEKLTIEEINLLEAQINQDNAIFMYSSINTENRVFYASDLSIWSSHSLFDSATKTDSLVKFFAYLRENLPSKIFIKVKKQFVLKNINTNINELNIDVTHHCVDKGSACVKLLEFLNLAPHEVLFIFNDKNDLPIINHPKLKDIKKLKVGKYLPEVKADYFATSPQYVAEILQQI